MMLLKDLQDVIKKSLSGEVGSALQSELKDLELLRLRIKQYDESDRDRKEELEELRAGREKSAEILLREAALATREIQQKHAVEMLKLRETHALDLVHNMKSVVSEVFANNNYKYNVTSSMNAQRPDGCITESRVETVEKTG